MIYRVEANVFPILIVLIFDQISLWYHQITTYSYQKIISVYPTIHTVYDDAIDFEIYALIKSKKKILKATFFSSENEKMFVLIVF